MSNDLATPSRMAMDGTTTMNFDQPYLRFNSNMVFVYTNVLPVPVSISTSSSTAPAGSVYSFGDSVRFCRRCTFLMLASSLSPSSSRSALR